MNNSLYLNLIIKEKKNRLKFLILLKKKYSKLIIFYLKEQKLNQEFLI